MTFHRLVLLSSLMLTACSATQFSASKQQVLATKSAFNQTGLEDSSRRFVQQPDAVGNGISQPGSGGGVGGQVGQPPRGAGSNGLFPGLLGQLPLPSSGASGGNVGSWISNTSQPDGTNDEVDILLMCSDARSRQNQNFKGALANNLPIKLLLDDKVCTQDANVIKSIVLKKKFSIADAQQICPALVPPSGQWSNVAIAVDTHVQTAIAGTITLLYAKNRETEPATEVADDSCDRRASPLVIHIQSDPNNPQPIALSSQDDGIDFPLLGAMNNFGKVRISWFTNKDYGLLTLPDASGNVRTIDQLFGNATVGPDGRFAENGYEALSKYDGTTVDGHFRVAAADGQIDRRDPIFGRLRVWIDSNRDGISQPSELTKLSRAKIVFIDLKYSNDYAETDVYGNQTLMKSVVGLADGSLDLIFDLWFSYRFL